MIREINLQTESQRLLPLVVELQDASEARMAHWPTGAQVGQKYLDYMMANCAAKDGVVYVWEEDGRLLGFVALLRSVPLDPDEGEGVYAFVSELSVTTEARGRGIGAALMHRAEEEARRLGRPTIHLRVLVANETAHRLYEKRGYEDRVVEMRKVL